MPPSTQPLPRTDPASAGISPAAVLKFISAMEADGGGPHSFVLMRHGAVAAEGWWHPYAPQYRHALFSLSKSFTSTAVGLAVSEGLLTVDDRVVSFFPERLPAAPSANLEAMRVRHLLSMSTGHDEDATGPTRAAADGDWVRAFLALPVEHAPGTKFVYNTAATYMCSAILQSLTGVTLLEYLTPRLFEPLGIDGAAWETCPRGINVGGSGLSVKTEDIARFGQCYLQHGAWGGAQVIPAEWVSEATAQHISNGEGDDSDWTQGYGFQFWRCRHDAYRGDGAFGQFCVVMPEQDAVLAVTAGTGDMQAVLDAAWDHLLPAMKSPSGAGDDAELRRRLSGLEIAAPQGSDTTRTAAQVSGLTWNLEPNDDGFATAVFTFSPNAAKITLAGEAGDRTFTAGVGTWREGPLDGQGHRSRPGAYPAGRVAVRGAWTDEGTYTMSVSYVETPFVETISCRFDADSVTLSRKMNTGFEPDERLPLVGHLP